MTQIFLDANLSNKLNELGQPAELCDPSGKVLGKFVPLIDLSEWEPVSPEASEEELDRRELSNQERYTITEVLDYLEKL
jgi:hypothetical protein